MYKSFTNHSINDSLNNQLLINDIESSIKNDNKKECCSFECIVNFGFTLLCILFITGIMIFFSLYSIHNEINDTSLSN